MTDYYVVLKTSRIADGNRVDQSGSDGSDVTGWDKTADFILGVQVDCEKGPIARAYKLQWRQLPDGTFADVGATGEISYAAVTVLVDGATLGSANKLCTGVPTGSTWQDGLESEDDNLLPDSGTYDLLDEYYTEFQWALDCSTALDGKEYEFQLYDVTLGAVIGVCPSTLTIATAGETFYQATGGASAAITGAIGKGTSKSMGVASLAIVGALARIATFYKGIGSGTISITGTLTRGMYKAVGAASMTIVGTLLAAKVALQAVGGASMAVVGSLATTWTRVLTVGTGSITIVGSLIKKISVSVGQASVTIAGALATIKTALQNVGAGAVSIVGSLATEFIEGGEAIAQAVGVGAVTIAGVANWWFVRILNLRLGVRRPFNISMGTRKAFSIKLTTRKAFDIDLETKGGG